VSAPHASNGFSHRSDWLSGSERRNSIEAIDSLPLDPASSVEVSLKFSLIQALRKLRQG
jgi:hypothetical protein